MALVDVLDYFPLAHPARPGLLAILNRTAEAIAAVKKDFLALCGFA